MWWGGSCGGVGHVAGRSSMPPEFTAGAASLEYNERIAYPLH